MRIKRRVACVGIAAAVTLAATASPGMAQSNETVTPSKVVAALSANSDKLITASASDNVQVPAQATKGVTLKAAGRSVVVHLPNASRAGKGVEVANGVTAYGAKNSANAVVSSDSGAQFLTVIGNRKAATSYTYRVDGGQFRVTPDGGATLTHRDGTPIAVFPAPWAYDAKGQQVSTRFTGGGHTLTQVVEHKSAGVAYPVVADPVPVWVILAIVRCGAAGSLAWVLSGGFDWWWRALAVAAACLKL